MRWLRPFLVSALLSATGCLRVNQALTINANGSGTMEIKYAVSNQAIRQMEAMRTLQNQLALVSGKPTPDDEETRYMYRFLLPNEKDLQQELQRYENLGIKVERLKVTQTGVWQNVDLKLLFDNLEGLSKTEPFRYVGFDLVKNSRGQYVFYRESKPKKGFAPPDFNDPATAKLLSPIFAGFRVSIALKTPGTILRTNAPRQSAYTSEWVFDFDQDPSAIVKIQTAKLITVFDGTGLTLPKIRH